MSSLIATASTPLISSLPNMGFLTPTLRMERQLRMDTMFPRSRSDTRRVITLNPPKRIRRNRLLLGRTMSMYEALVTSFFSSFSFSIPLSLFLYLSLLLFLSPPPSFSLSFATLSYFFICSSFFLPSSFFFSSSSHVFSFPSSPSLLSPPLFRFLLLVLLLFS